METLRVCSANIRFGPGWPCSRDAWTAPQGAGPLVCARLVRVATASAAGNRLRHFSASVVEPRAVARSHTTVPAGTHPMKNVDTTTRNPLFLLRLFGCLLLRYAQRTLFSVLLNAPPRNTRWRYEPIPSAGQRQTVTAIGDRAYRLPSIDLKHHMCRARFHTRRCRLWKADLQKRAARGRASRARGGAPPLDSPLEYGGSEIQSPEASESRGMPCCARRNGDTTTRNP